MALCYSPPTKPLRFVSEVVIGAPYTIDEQMMKHFKIDLGTKWLTFQIRLFSHPRRYRNQAKRKQRRPVRLR